MQLKEKAFMPRLPTKIVVTRRILMHGVIYMVLIILLAAISGCGTARDVSTKTGYMGTGSSQNESTHPP